MPLARCSCTLLLSIPLLLAPNDRPFEQILHQLLFRPRTSSHHVLHPECPCIGLRPGGCFGSPFTRRYRESLTSLAILSQLTSKRYVGLDSRLVR